VTVQDINALLIPNPALRSLEPRSLRSGAALSPGLRSSLQGLSCRANDCPGVATRDLAPASAHTVAPEFRVGRRGGGDRSGGPRTSSPGRWRQSVWSAALEPAAALPRSVVVFASSTAGSGPALFRTTQRSRSPSTERLSDQREDRPNGALNLPAGVCPVGDVLGRSSSPRGKAFILQFRVAARGVAQRRDRSDARSWRCCHAPLAAGPLLHGPACWRTRLATRQHHHCGRSPRLCPRSSDGPHMFATGRVGPLSRARWAEDLQR